MTTASASLTFLPWVRQGARRRSSPRRIRSAPTSLAWSDLERRRSASTIRRCAADDGAPARSGRRGRHRRPPDHPHRAASWQQRFRAELFPSHRVRSCRFPLAVHAGGRRATRKLRPWLCLVVVRKQDGVTLGSTRRLRRCRAADRRARQALGRTARSRRVLGLGACAGRRAPTAARPGRAGARRRAGTVAVAADLSADSRAQHRLHRLRGAHLRARPQGRARACRSPTPISSRPLRSRRPGRSTPAPRKCRCRSTTHWEFRTGPGGDFESLAARAAAAAGAGWTGPAQRSTSASPASRCPRDSRRHHVGSSKARCGRSAPDASAGAGPTATRAVPERRWPRSSTRRAHGGVDRSGADPLLAPPLYGRWHAARATRHARAAPLGSTS